MHNLLIGHIAATHFHLPQGKDKSILQLHTYPSVGWYC